MKHPVLSIICLFVLSTVTAQRIKYNFNSNWKVFVGDDSAASAKSYKDDSWKNVTLPYAWNEDEAFRKDIAELSTGIAWYRKHFKIDAAHKDQKILLEFEGIRQAGEFYINGKFIGLHENGVTAFGFDITDYARYGDEENIIAARINNDWEYKEKATGTKFQWEDKNFNANYGGINKNVFLHITNKVYQTLPLYSNLQTTGVYVYADNFNIKEKAATIHTQSEVKNESNQQQQVQYEVKVFDLNNKLIKSFSGESMALAGGETRIVKAAAAIRGLNFWSWGYGYYTLLKQI